MYNIYINNIEQEGKIVDTKEAIKARRSIRKYKSKRQICIKNIGKSIEKI